MNSRFGLAEQLKGAAGAGFHGFGEMRGADDSKNCGQRTVRRVAVLVRVLMWVLMRFMSVLMRVLIRVLVRLM